MDPKTMRQLGIPVAAALLLALLALAPVSARAQKKKKKNPVTIRVSVTVVNPKGLPVQDAGVVLRQERGATGRIPKDAFHVEIHTDEHGKAIVQGFEPGVVLVQVISKQFQTWGEAFIMSKPDEAVYVKLKPPQAQVTIFGKGAAGKKKPAGKKGDGDGSGGS